MQVGGCESIVTVAQGREPLQGGRTRRAAAAASRHRLSSPALGAAIQRLAASLDDVASIAAGGFDHQLHYWDAEQPDAVAQYLLVVDALVSWRGADVALMWR